MLSEIKLFSFSSLRIKNKFQLNCPQNRLNLPVTAIFSQYVTILRIINCYPSVSWWQSVCGGKHVLQGIAVMYRNLYIEISLEFWLISEIKFYFSSSWINYKYQLICTLNHYSISVKAYIFTVCYYTSYINYHSPY